MRIPFLKRFLYDQRGANILEFAFVAPVFFLLLLGIMEFGLYMFNQVMIQSIAYQAAREASLGRISGTGSCSTTVNTVQYITCLVQQKSSSLVRGNAVQVAIARTTPTGGVAQPDVCILANGEVSSTVEPCPTNQWEEVNGITGYQSLSGVNNSGAAGEIVEVRVIYPWRTLIPYASRYFGTRDANGVGSGVVLISASTVVKNEPF